ncbi:unnamed protein product [Pseudo-nitzschia multistriata]|uniref:Potassium channel tetramerisation-type BTB domain-containing protein n=1 Tax=Pseudo-nitzschia multistriata TaxID=183589 RepID=A0A448ZKZ6_9STRA|nr:unnamed protein product [Pseudo-nitzschia multistriata]
MPKRKSSSVKDALSALTDVLSEREKALEEGEEKLRREREALEALEAEKASFYGETKPSDVLHLNVGGTKTSVLRRTLTSVPGSMLAARFSGRWDDSLEKDKDGHFFIEQNFETFEIMLKYLRNKANGTEKYSIASPSLRREQKQDFYRMLHYFGMTDGIYPTKLMMKTVPKIEDAVEIIGTKKVIAKEFTTFQMAPDGHSRRVKGFEIRLGTTQRIQVGWSYKNDDVMEKSVGHYEGSFALDLTGSSFLVGGGAKRLSYIEHPEGTVVRSENFGRTWYVNGELLTVNASNDQVEKIWRRYWSNLESLRPLISIEGEVEVTSVELVD